MKNIPSFWLHIAKIDTSEGSFAKLDKLSTTMLRRTGGGLIQLGSYLCHFPPSIRRRKIFLYVLSAWGRSFLHPTSLFSVYPPHGYISSLPPFISTHLYLKFHRTAIHWSPFLHKTLMISFELCIWFSRTCHNNWPAIGGRF